jgi:hypothetical protein
MHNKTYRKLILTHRRLLTKYPSGPLKSKKTVTRTFRISEESFNAVEQDALLHNVSVNTLVNQVLETYAIHERFMAKFGMMRMTKSTFRRVLEKIPADEVPKAAMEHSKELGIPLVVSRYGEFGLTTLLDGLQLMMTYGGWGQYQETESSQGKRVITLMHDMGQIGSIYLHSFVKYWFEAIGKEPKIITTDQALMIEF